MNVKKQMYIKPSGDSSMQHHLWLQQPNRSRMYASEINQFRWNRPDLVCT